MSNITAGVDREIQLKALSSSVRIRILQLLADPSRNFSHQWSADPAVEGVCMSLIAQAIAVAQPTASRHIEILKNARFLSVTRIGKWGHCRREEEAILDYLQWLARDLRVAEK